MVIIGISKGGRGALLPVEVFRAADVVMFTDGVAFLYFPPVPSELYKLSDKYLDILKKLLIMH